MTEALRPTLEQRFSVRKAPKDRVPVMFQTWTDLLFLHWRYDAEAIQRTLPSGLRVDTFEGQAYLAVVPFFMCHIRPRLAPEVPHISNFLELNVRTYVHDRDGVPGVWFYSLDANRRLAVAIARKFFKLPYFFSEMHADRGEWIDYRCLRKGEHEEARYRYRGTDDAVEAPPDTLEFFLLERYLLYSGNGVSGTLHRGRVHHRPYHFRHAEVNPWSALPLKLAGFSDPERPPDHQCVATGDLEVSVYGLERAE